jgi:deoxyribonucleoside regulator
LYLQFIAQLNFLHYRHRVFIVKSLERIAVARPTRQHDMVLKIARLRYEDRLAQNEIATLLGISTATVSRCLALALDSGLVEVRIAAHSLRNRALEEQMTRKFGLTTAVIVDGQETHSETRHVLAQAVARVIESLIGEGDVIGVSDGDTTAAIAFSARKLRLKNVDILPLVGGVGRTEEASHSSQVCRSLAQALGGRAWQLPVPALVDSLETATTLVELAHVRDTFALMDRLSMAIFGIGAMSERATVFRHGVLGPEYMQAIRNSGAVGSICARFFSSRGEPIATAFDARTLSLRLDQLLKTPCRIGVAVGADKAAPVHAALTGGLVSVLGLDTATAKLVLDM